MSSADMKALSNDDIPAAFWDTLPEKVDNADLLAIQALQGESTPEERAEILKLSLIDCSGASGRVKSCSAAPSRSEPLAVQDQANQLFTRGAQLRKTFLLQQAVDKYSEADDLLSTDSSRLKSVILSNRAQAQLKLGNNRSALNDALAAISLDEENFKQGDLTQAAFRGALAAKKLEEFDQALDLCSRTSSALEFEKLREEIRAGKAAKAEELEQRAAARAPSKLLAQKLLSRGWQVGAPQMNIGNRKPFADAEDKVHWPVVVQYPAVMQSDMLEDVHEDNTFKEIMDLIFGPDSPPLPWDSEGLYTRDNLETFYLANACKVLRLEELAEALYTGWSPASAEAGPAMYGKKAARFRRIPEAATLGEALSMPGHVVSGVPAIFVVAKGTDYWREFVQNLQ